MKAVELKYSKSKVDKAGEVLKSKELSTELDVLSSWRAFRARPLVYCFLKMGMFGGNSLRKRKERVQLKVNTV